ncbi:hypothetical protein LINPERHAP2_LOCUS4389 [Linum perenne]
MIIISSDWTGPCAPFLGEPPLTKQFYTMSR